MSLVAREAGPQPMPGQFGPRGDNAAYLRYLWAWHLWRAVQRDARLTEAEGAARLDVIIEALARVPPRRLRAVVEQAERRILEVSAR